MPKRSRRDTGSADAEHPVVSLPEDILSAVFSHLDVAERALASRVCRRWRAAALHPPYSTSLELCVDVRFGPPPLHLTQAIILAKCMASRSSSWRAQMQSTNAWPAIRELQNRPKTAAAALRGPLCGGLQRLSLELTFDPNTSGASRMALELKAICEALPPTLLGLKLSSIASSIRWKELLDRLDLARTAPLLEELELAGPGSLVLAQLDLSHPSLRRLAADVNLAVYGLLSEYDQIVLALSHLPRLEVLGRLQVHHITSSFLDALTKRGIRTERLRMISTSFSEAHARFLQPGASLELIGSPLPADGGWTVPAGLAELRLDCRILPPTLLQSLLGRTSTHAPGLQRLVISSRCPSESTPSDIIAALEGVSGGTQIEIEISEYTGVWKKRDILTSLARTLATRPILHRFVHIALDRLLQTCTTAAAADYATYRRARIAVLRGMGAAGRRLLAEQGYDHDPLGIL